MYDADQNHQVGAGQRAFHPCQRLVQVYASAMSISSSQTLGAGTDRAVGGGRRPLRLALPMERDLDVRKAGDLCLYPGLVRGGSLVTDLLAGDRDGRRIGFVGAPRCSARCRG